MIPTAFIILHFIQNPNMAYRQHTFLQVQTDLEFQSKNSIVETRPISKEPGLLERIGYENIDLNNNILFSSDRFFLVDRT